MPSHEAPGAPTCLAAPGHNLPAPAWPHWSAPQDSQMEIHAAPHRATPYQAVPRRTLSPGRATPRRALTGLVAPSMTLPGSCSASQERRVTPQIASTPDLAEPQLVRPGNTSPQAVPRPDHIAWLLVSRPCPATTPHRRPALSCHDLPRLIPPGLATSSMAGLEAACHPAPPYRAGPRLPLRCHTLSQPIGQRRSEPEHAPPRPTPPNRA